MRTKGFFSTENMSKIRIEGSSCFSCKLFKEVQSPKMPVSGEGNKSIFILGEGPGRTEDLKNTQFVGDAGDFLRTKLTERGLALDGDFWKDNAIRCRATDKKGENRKPEKKELSYCKSNWETAVNQLKPKFIWLLGAAAVESYCLNRFSKNKITLWRGLCIPDYKYGAWVLPMYHPSFAMRKQEDEIIQSVYDRDLDHAVSCLDLKPVGDRPDIERCVIKLTTFDQVCDELEHILKVEPEVLVFDYETTGLKPYSKGHKIASVSFCHEEHRAYSFPYEYNNHWTPLMLRQIKKRWRDILTNPNIGKVAQNSKYEYNWSWSIFGVEPVNWKSCTMNTTHILDNRKEFTGLKFQAFVRYGIEEYDKHTKPYLEANNGRFNRVMEIPLQDLLLYNGLDSLLTYWLFLDQQSELDSKTRKAHDFITEGLTTLARMQHNGIPVIRKYYEQKSVDLGKEIADLEREIKQFPEIKEFEERKKRPINLNSDFDMRELFFKQMGLKPTKFTDSELESVDYSVLLGLKNPISEKLIRMNKLSKTKSTYIDQFIREIEDDDKIHPFFDLHTVRTFRSGSSRPNFQNIPVRDKEAKEISRRGIIPSKGNLILDRDYGSQEVRIIACYTKDPTLIAYCNDPNSDMHRDEAMKIFELDKNEVTKDIRFYGKNCFVFPEFYNSYYVSCARDLRKNCWHLKTKSGVPVWQHLMNKRIIQSPEDKSKLFEKHVQGVESDFFKRYKYVKRWQKKVAKEFIENGYVKMFDGFRYGGGIVTLNKLANAPIQGTAFHCLLWSMIEIDRIAKEEHWNTKSIGEIHDAELYDTDPSEKQHVKDVVNYVSTQFIREEKEWLIVPLVTEWDETKVNQPWYYKETKED